MSEQIYNAGGLRFWNESEIEIREAFQARVASVIKRQLLSMNPAFRVARVEGPIITPRDMMKAYGDDDVFPVAWGKADIQWALRAETTASTYAMMRCNPKFPMCYWQAGKSFRKEENDGASAAKLRFNEFWQQEFQIAYREDTKADYRAALIPLVAREVARFTLRKTRVIESDRLPDYSDSTLDIEVSPVIPGVPWREVASCSIRNDFGLGIKVAEIAIGLCRIAALAA
jgi:glycyl-tRNA synthetase